MAKKIDTTVNRKTKIPKASSLALRGRQSVRATFKLTESCIDAINIVATHLGIKQKSLFDHLIEDTEALKSIAHDIKNQNLASRPVVTKTFVINRHSLDVLNEMSDEYDVAKEYFIELSVHRLLPIIAKEQVTHEERKKIIKQIDTHLKQGKTIQNKIRKQFGSNDIVYKKYDEIMRNYQNCTDVIKKYIDKSRSIEKFELDSF